MTPTQRTLKALREQGMIAGIVERWIPRINIRRDLFGILDIVALHPVRGVVGVQSTGQDFAGHMAKMTVEKRAECMAWLKTPGTALELWGWSKLLVKRGGKARTWQPRVHVFTMEDFPPAP